MTQLETQPLNQAVAEAFAERMLRSLNDTAVAMMISIGHRTGLFDAMAEMPPSTSEKIAARSELHERYVREWLGAMVTGRIVEYDVATETYRLPPEHAACLTRTAAPHNMAATMQWLSILGCVEDKVVNSFREGGGVHYCHYHRFHEVMAEESSQTVVAGLTEHILPLVPGLLERLESGIDVVDIGCGSGWAMVALAEAFPASRFAGYDFSEEAIASATQRAEARGLTNVRFAAQDLSTWDERAAYDVITAFDVIHDQARPDLVLQNVSRALRDDGTFLMQDIAASSSLEKNMDNPLAPFFYTISTMHCMTVSLAQGGMGLGTVWGQELAEKMLGEAGFKRVQTQTLPHDIQNLYYVAAKR